MKPGDIFHRMSSETRMRHVASRRYDFREVYNSPDELIADVSLILSSLDRARSQLNDVVDDMNKLANARVEISNDIASAFKRFEFLYQSIPKYSKVYDHAGVPNTAICASRQEESK